MQGTRLGFYSDHLKFLNKMFKDPKPRFKDKPEENDSFLVPFHV
jgi:hypothetical protein